MRQLWKQPSLDRFIFKRTNKSFKHTSEDVMCESSVGCERNEKGNEIIRQSSLERFIIKDWSEKGK